jgi:hypothetical protein
MQNSQFRKKFEPGVQWRTANDFYPVKEPGFKILPVPGREYFPYEMKFWR